MKEIVFNAQSAQRERERERERHTHTHTHTHTRTHARTHARTHSRTHPHPHPHTHTQRERERDGAVLKHARDSRRSAHESWVSSRVKTRHNRSQRSPFKKQQQQNKTKQQEKSPEGLFSVAHTGGKLFLTRARCLRPSCGGWKLEPSGETVVPARIHVCTLLLLLSLG